MRRSSIVEVLEGRRMLVGNVTVTDANGVITITGDNKSNQIAMDLNVTGAGYTIKGLNGTSVNGEPSVLVPVGPSVYRGVNVSMDNGDDLVRVDGDFATNRPFFATFLDVRTGNGNDAVVLNFAWIGNDNTHIDTGNGSDTVETFFGGRYDGGLDINTGNGDDAVALSTFTEMYDHLRINLGNGADSLSLGLAVRVNSHGVGILDGGNGPDTLTGLDNLLINPADLTVTGF